MSLLALTKIAPLFVQKYERYIPTAFNDSLTMLEKVNKIIEHFNLVVQYNNEFSESVSKEFDNFSETITKNFDSLDVNFDELAKDVSDFRKSVENEILPASLELTLNKWLDNGKLSNVINDEVFGMKANTSLVEEKTGFIPYGDVSSLSPFPLEFPVYVEPTGISTTFSARRFINNFPIVYVDGVNGLDTNNGLTESTAVKTLGAAHAIANSSVSPRVVIKVLNKYFAVQTTYTFTMVKGISVELPTNGLIFTGYQPESFVWTADSGVHQTLRTGVWKVFDGKNGHVREVAELKQVDTLSACQNTRNTWYTNGSQVYVHTFDGRPPDNDILLVLPLNVGLVFQPSSHELFLHNVQTLIRSNTTATSGITINGTPSSKIYALNSGAYYAKNMGMSINNFDLLVLINPRSAHCDGDAFNYHGDVNSKVVIVNLRANSAGINSTANNINASTGHDGMSIFEVGSVAHDTRGPVIAHVNGCKSVLIECHARNALNVKSETKSAFYFDNVSAVNPGYAILYGCSGGGVDTYGLNSDKNIAVTVSGFNGEIKR